jgi:hypothetical protein
MSGLKADIVGLDLFLRIGFTVFISLHMDCGLPSFRDSKNVNIDERPKAGASAFRRSTFGVQRSALTPFALWDDFCPKAKRLQDSAVGFHAQLTTRQREQAERPGAPAHFQRNPPGRGRLAVFPCCSLDPYDSDMGA